MQNNLYSIELKKIIDKYIDKDIVLKIVNGDHIIETMQGIIRALNIAIEEACRNPNKSSTSYIYNDSENEICKISNQKYLNEYKIIVSIKDIELMYSNGGILLTIIKQLSKMRIYDVITICIDQIEHIIKSGKSGDIYSNVPILTSTIKSCIEYAREKGELR